MNILILLVIAFIVITAAFVGYNVTQRQPAEAEGHNISIELKSFSEDHELIQIFSKSDILKAVI